MNSLFVPLFLASLIALIIGLVKPYAFKKLFKAGPTRKKIALLFGGLAFVSMVFISPEAPSTANPPAANQPVSSPTASVSAPEATVENQAARVSSPEAKNESPDTQKEKSPPSAPAEATEPTKPDSAQFEDGNHIVGTDIQPGTYRTRKGSSGCYYARLRGFGGSYTDVIANANTSAPAVVTIAATDKGFESKGCGTWTQDLSAIISGNGFGDGIFIVGTDLTPGTYRSSGGDGCYYARLKSFGGSYTDVIANENTNASAVVTIGIQDKGFASSGCGTWSKVE